MTHDQSMPSRPLEAAQRKDGVNVVVNVHHEISYGNKMNRHTDIKRESEPPAELESQFVLRLPPVRTINMYMSPHNLNEVFNVNISVYDPPVAVFINLRHFFYWK
jgi:hypothetical protein